MRHRLKFASASAQPAHTHAEIVTADGTLVGDCHFPNVQSAAEIAHGLKAAIGDLGRIEVQEVTTRVVLEREVRTAYVLP